MSEREQDGDTAAIHVSAALGAIHGTGVWRRRAHEMRQIAGRAPTQDEHAALGAMAYGYRLRESARFGESMGRLFRALELAYDMGTAHGRKVTP